MKQRWVIAAMLVAALVITAGVAYQAAADCFLKVDGIQGDSQDSKHREEIQVLSWSWGETNTGSMQASGGGEASRTANFKDIVFTARISKASPKLFSAGTGGQKHIGTAILTCRKPVAAGGGSQLLEYLKITLSDVLVSSYLSGYPGPGGVDVPSDQFSFNFSKINMEYLPLQANGTPDRPVSAGFDLRTRKNY